MRGDRSARPALRVKRASCVRHAKSRRRSVVQLPRYQTRGLRPCIYKGRIVISTGNIKTDSTRETNDDEEETKTEWYSSIDKDGIMIEDAVPIVRLSRVKKDKRVYGVFGSPTRSTNNKNRLIVNSVGEGAIRVCNTSGNIENGD